MQEKTQLAILLENNSGELAKVFKLFAKAKVNISALTLDDGVHHGILKVVVDNPLPARKALDKAKIRFSEHKVVSVQLPNRPGALAEITTKLAKRKVNIGYLYGSTCECCSSKKGEDGCECVCIMSVDQAKEVAAILG